MSAVPTPALGTVGGSHLYAGNGDTHVHHHYPTVHGRETGTDSDPLRIADDGLRILAEAFVPPRHMGRARSTLREHLSVLVLGRRGVGRRSAAKALLREHLQGAESIREINAHEDEEEGPPLSPARVGEGEKILLDLSEADDNECRSLLARLPPFHAAVRERSARLAVVLSGEAARWAPSELEHVKVALGRPQGRRVFLRQLAVRGVVPDPLHLTEPRLTVILDEAPMSEISELVRHVVDARALQPSAPFSAWRDGALDVLERRTDHVAEKLDSLTGRGRAVLLATAYLHDARVEAVQTAATQLLRCARHPGETSPLLESLPAGQQLTAVGATFDEERRVRFTTLDFDRSARTYCWDNYPQLRPTLHEWVGRLTTSTGLDERERRDLVARYVEQYARTALRPEIDETIKAWTAVDNPASLQAATELLTTMVQGPDGGHYRWLLYQWATDRRLPIPQAETLVGVCSGDMAVRFPDQAMVRLRHMARHEHKRIRVAARAALERATYSDDRLYTRLVQKLAPGPEGRARNDARLFLGLAKPSRLTQRTRTTTSLLDTRAAREQLAGLWGTVLRTCPEGQWAGPVRDWLTHAAAVPIEQRTSLLGLLVDGIGDEVRAPARLYAVARQWARQQPTAARATTAAHLRSLIDTAQGIGTS